MPTRDRRTRAPSASAPDRESGIEVRGGAAAGVGVGVPSNSHIRSTVANSAESSRSRASLGGRFARNGEMNAQLLQLETAMDDLAAQNGVPEVVCYVHKFTESARAVEHALSLALRTSLTLVTKHGSHPPETLFACVDVVHAYIFDLAEHIAELIELQAGARGAWGIPGRFLPEYSARYVSCKIEPAIEALLITCEELITQSELGGRKGPGTPLLSAVDLLCEAVITLDEQLRLRG